MTRPLVFMVAAAFAAPPAAATVQLASPFTDHMVLQRDTRVPVWGTAAPGERVNVTFAGRTKTATAAPDGGWRIDLDPLNASGRSRVLVVSGSETTGLLTFEDVLVGEVWLASGQSNMDFTLGRTEKYYFAGVLNETAELAAADDPALRMFTGEWARSYEPQPRVGGTWKVCTPENAREFSAVAYFFARALRQELGVPVGILTLTYGASTPQAWIRREAITPDPRLKPVLDTFDAGVAAFRADPAAGAGHAQAVTAWEEASARARAAGERPPRRPRDPDPVQDQHNPTVMYNGMIAPVVPFALRGFLWYQGESITEPKDLFPAWNQTLIRDWRALWNGTLPFYFCQLAAYPKASHDPQVRAWQAEALRLPQTGMAVTIDVGDEGDVHPKDKRPVGERLARLALARTYKRRLECDGPEYESSERKNATLRLRFRHAGRTLTTRGGPLMCFEVAGADGRFVAAEAEVQGTTVVLRSSEVPAPAAARYAWSPYPPGGFLYNDAGLPAAPFETGPLR